MGRAGAYKVLYNALVETNQSGAARILVRVPTELFSKPLTYLGISTEMNVFQNVEIEVNGKTFKLREFLPQVDYQIVQRIFQETIPEVEFYDSFIIKKRKFILSKNTIPAKQSYYVPRYLSNRIKIEEYIFKADCPDVFVFKNSITRYKLSEIAEPHFTATSISQLTNITCRFIHLVDTEDWAELKKISAKVPIHLINYEKDGNHFILEDSSAPSHILEKVSSQNKRVYMSEEEFVQQQLPENSVASSSACICDSPGMGKTFLLANVARLFTKHCPGTIVAFIQLSTFVAEFAKTDPKAGFLNVLKCISTSQENAKLLVNLVEAELLRMKIFFDGFDEIPTDGVEWMKQIFLTIKSQLPKVQIYITSRPNMRHELEKSLNVITYEILPFSLQNQVDFLVRFWSSNVPKIDQRLLYNYALTCLREINKTLWRTDKEMTGLPLLCRLIGEVCSYKVHFYSTTGTKNIIFPSKIAAMYQQFIEQRFNAATTTEQDLNNIKLFHIWLALRLLFPEHGFHHDEIFAGVHKVTVLQAAQKAGIIQLLSNTKVQFLHRTFAEYFVADYFSAQLQSIGVKPSCFAPSVSKVTKKVSASILHLLLATHTLHNTFVHYVVVSFFDFTLNKIEISEELKGRVASFCASVSPIIFISVLCSCCRHNLYNLFSLLKEALAKWRRFQNKRKFTTKYCFRLLSVCIIMSSTQLFQSCIQLLTEVLQLDVEQIAIHDERNTLLHIAAKAANYEAAYYFLDRVPIELQQGVLETCVKFSRDNDVDMLMRREQILHSLLNKNPSLIQQTPHILRAPEIDLGLFKELVGAYLSATNIIDYNCAMVAFDCMSPKDYHELVQFLLTDCNAEYLFRGNENWQDPLPKIIKYARLLPETLELLLNIPGNHINMKDKRGDNLLFSAAYGNAVDNLKELMERGLDYNARGSVNESLLHAAAGFGGVEMVRHLLSLKLDPNSRNKNGWTPLHYAAEGYEWLSVVEVLVKNGANVHAKNNDGQTALHFCAAKYSHLSVEVIKYLIGKGAQVNHRDNDGNTPLHLCKEKEKEAVVELLIGLGADIHVKNDKGRTPAQIYPKLCKYRSCFEPRDKMKETAIAVVLIFIQILVTIYLFELPSIVPCNANNK